MSARPKHKGRLARDVVERLLVASQAAGVQEAKGKRLCRVRDAAAASGGPAAEDIGAPPKHKGLHAPSVASRAYLLRRQQGGSR